MEEKTRAERMAKLQAEMDRLKAEERIEKKVTREQPKGNATRALTDEQYNEIIDAMRSGFTGFRPNNQIATALVLEANLGLRISDIVQLKLSSIVQDGDRRRLDIVEQKTGKKRTFTVPQQIYMYIENYCLKNGIGPDERIFPVTARSVQRQLKKVCDWLGYDHISTHSFRKYYATNIYKNNGYNVVLVQKLLQHASPETTQKYIGIQSEELENAINGNLNLK